MANDGELEGEVRPSRLRRTRGGTESMNMTMFTEWGAGPHMSPTHQRGEDMIIFTRGGVGMLLVCECIYL